MSRRGQTRTQGQAVGLSLVPGQEGRVQRWLLLQWGRLQRQPVGAIGTKTKPEARSWWAKTRTNTVPIKIVENEHRIHQLQMTFKECFKHLSVNDGGAVAKWSKALLWEKINAKTKKIPGLPFGLGKLKKA